MNKAAVVSGVLALSALGAAACGPHVDTGARVAVVGHTAYAYPNGLVAAGAVDSSGNPITDVVVVGEYCGPLLNVDYSKLAEDDHCASWWDADLKDWTIGKGSSYSPNVDHDFKWIVGA
jgi:hypothetical protein